jgi:hypothetical protein
LKNFLVCASLVAGLLAAPVSAATFRIDAVTAPLASDQFAPFTITFEDSNGDELLQVGEILTFSTFTSSIGNPAPVLFDSVLFAPNQSGISTSERAVNGSSWLFGSSVGNDANFGRAGWTYTKTAITTDPPVVPLPAGLPLLLAGLGAFGFMARRKRG